MKISEKIIRYADGDMEPAERKNFEQELANSGKLREELASYKYLLSEAREAKDISVEKDYFTSIIPVFRQKQAEPGKKWLFPGVAFGVALVTAIILFVINNKEIEKIVPDTPLQEFTAAEVDSILNYYPSDYTAIDPVIAENENLSDVVNELFISELNITEDEKNTIYSYSSIADFNQSLENLSSEETEIVYNEILNKRFF